MLVDEYQDTNKLQASILLSMKPDGRGLTVVGDDAQSIYLFRGATVRNILDFLQHFTSDRPKCVTLERNYRSTQPILEASNAGDRARVRAKHEEPWWTGQAPRCCARASFHGGPTRPTRRAIIVEKELEAARPA